MNEPKANNSVDALPPQIVATPSDMPETNDQDVPWWRPDWRDTVRYVGYRWIFLLPVLLLFALAVAVLFLPAVKHFSPTYTIGISLLKLAVPIVVSLGAFAIRNAVRARKEPFCIHCGYNLTGLPDNYRCPECGRPYSWKVIDEYRRDRQGFIDRWKAHKRLPPAESGFDAGRVARKRRARDGTE